MTEQQIDRDRLRALADQYDDSTIDGGPDMAAGAIRQLLGMLDQAEARIKAVRELHSESRIIPGTPVFGCAECGEPNETEPCATIRALDGER